MKSIKVMKIFVSVLVIGTLSLGTWAFAEVVINKEQSKESATKVSGISSVAKDSIGTEVVAISGDMTMEELKGFNGQNGQPAYIAIEGVIYDVSALGDWSDGSHKGYKAGNDLTEAFSQSPHAMSILNDAIIIGNIIIKEDQTVNETQNDSTVTANTTQTDVDTTETAIVANTTPTGVWTLEKLAAYNGKNGQPAYIAVNGTIYDVTSLGSWSNGTHNGYSAGVDLTDAFSASPHSMSILSSAIVVGTIGQNMTTQNPTEAIDQAVISQNHEDKDEDNEDYNVDKDDDHFEDYNEDKDDDHFEDYNVDKDDDHYEDYNVDKDVNHDDDHDDNHDEDHDDERDDD